MTFSKVLKAFENHLMANYLPDSTWAPNEENNPKMKKKKLHRHLVQVKHRSHTLPVISLLVKNLVHGLVNQINSIHQLIVHDRII